MIMPTDLYDSLWGLSGCDSIGRMRNEVFQKFGPGYDSSVNGGKAGIAYPGCQVEFVVFGYSRKRPINKGNGPLPYRIL